MPEGGRGPESGASVAAGPVGSAVGPVAFGARAPDARGPPCPGRVCSTIRAGNPVVERPRSTTAAGIAPTARRGAAGPSNRATTPTNRLPRPCRGAPPLHDTIPACRRGAPTSPRLHPMARTGADHDSVARSPHNVVAMLCGAPRGVDRRGGGSPRTSLGPGPAVRIAPGGRSRRHESRRRTASSGIRGRRGRPEFPDSGERPYRPGFVTLGAAQRHKSRMMPLISVIRDTGRGSASRITDDAARFRNPGHWERLSIPDYGRRRPFPESGTLSAAQRQESRTKPLFSGIRDTAPVD